MQGIPTSTNPRSRMTTSPMTEAAPPARKGSEGSQEVVIHFATPAASNVQLVSAGAASHLLPSSSASAKPMNESEVIDLHNETLKPGGVQHYIDLLKTPANYAGNWAAGKAATIAYLTNLKQAANAPMRQWASNYQSYLVQGHSATLPELPAEFTTYQGQMQALAKGNPDLYREVFPHVYRDVTKVPVSIPQPIIKAEHAAAEDPVGHDHKGQADEATTRITVPGNRVRLEVEQQGQEERRPLSLHAKCCLVGTFLTGVAGAYVSWWQMGNYDQGSVERNACIGGFTGGAGMAASSVMAGICLAFTHSD